VIGEEIEMQNAEALDIVAEYRTRHGLPGILEALQQMEHDEDLSDRERKAWNVAMRGFNRLFNGDENVRQI
jgi:hypothetical protein